jgi:cyanuric acid amidohydrolase
MDAPDDLTGLREAIGRGMSPSDLAAVFVKTEGNGLDNDWSRPLAVSALRGLLGESAAATIVVSGGCEGFITPHMVLAMRADDGLRFGRVDAPALAAHEIGTAAQVEATARAIAQACAQAGISADEVGYAHIVAPWIEASMPVTGPTVARDAHGSKPFSRAASALGAAVALDGLVPTEAVRALREHDGAVHGSRCAVTAGGTGGRVRVMVFARTGSGQRAQRLACSVLRDPLCADQARALLPAGHRPVAVLLKGDPPGAGRLRGERVVLGNDSDIHAFRHYRAAMSGVLGAALGTTRLFIGGGAEHQCPPGGALLTLVSEPETR